MALVHHIVNRVAKGFPSFVERDDLVQAGMMGLVEAAQRFDATTGASFASFAGRRIEGAILDYVRADSWMPRQLRAVEKQISAVEDRFAIEGDNSDATVAQELHLQVDQLRAIRRDLARARTTSLDRTFDDEGSPMSESIESNDMSPSDKAEFEELRRLLSPALNCCLTSNATSSLATTSKKSAFPRLQTKWALVYPSVKN